MNIIMKCKTCKKNYDFYIHECEYSNSEYYGCEKCDNVCLKCSKEFRNLLNKKKDNNEKRR